MVMRTWNYLTISENSQSKEHFCEQCHQRQTIFQYWPTCVYNIEIFCFIYSSQDEPRKHTVCFKRVVN